MCSTGRKVIAFLEVLNEAGRALEIGYQFRVFMLFEEGLHSQVTEICVLTQKTRLAIIFYDVICDCILLFVRKDMEMFASRVWIVRSPVLLEF